jgi:hypothetical protein
MSVCTDVMQHILYFLDVKEIINVGYVCKDWQNIICMPTSWIYTKMIIKMNITKRMPYTPYLNKLVMMNMYYIQICRYNDVNRYVSQLCILKSITLQYIKTDLLLQILSLLSSTCQNIEHLDISICECNSNMHHSNYSVYLYDIQYLKQLKHLRFETRTTLYKTVFIFPALPHLQTLELIGKYSSDILIQILSYYEVPFSQLKQIIIDPQQWLEFQIEYAIESLLYLTPYLQIIHFLSKCILNTRTQLLLLKMKHVSFLMQTT